MEGVGWGMKGMQDLHGRLTATDLVCNAASGSSLAAIPSLNTL